MDEDKFLGRFTADRGATGSAGLAVIGNRLGLYRALAQGPAAPQQLAERTGCHERYLAEWLRNQAAGGYVSCDVATGEFYMTEEQTFCLADPTGPQAGEAAIRDVATQAGFTRFRRAAESPFNLVFEIRP